MREALATRKMDEKNAYRTKVNRMRNKRRRGIENVQYFTVDDIKYI